MKFSNRWKAYLGVAFLVLTPLAFTCGLYFRTVYFVRPHTDLRSGLAEGELGVIRSSFDKELLLVAYRTLASVPLTDGEKKALLQGPLEPPYEFEQGQSSWLEQRRLAGAPQSGFFVTAEKMTKNYRFFINCNNDAFDTASLTLQTLSEKYGDGSPAVKDWLSAQDIVFADCSKEAGIPDELGENASPELRAYRRYQIAAANFYLGNYDQAAAQFGSIGRDQASPWREYGLLLEARSYIRKGTLSLWIASGGEDAGLDLDALRKAEHTLQAVIADPSLAETRDSAKRLLAFVELRVHAQQRATELGELLAKPSDGRDFRQNIVDYFRLNKDYRGPDDEMVDWIEAIKDKDKESIARWKSEPKSLLWLLAALQATDAKTPERNELISAGLGVKKSSTGYLTAQYYTAKLRIEGGEKAEARRQLDDFLADTSSKLPVATKNEFLILRREASADLADFARRAVLRPAGINYGEEDEPLEECTVANKCPQEMIEIGAARTINRMPLNVLLRIAEQSDASLVLRRGTAIISWERGLLLNDIAAADRAARILGEFSKNDAADLDDFLKASDHEAKRFAGALTMLRWPGAQPRLISDTLREEPMRALDNFRGNWWCQKHYEPPAQEALSLPDFISKADQAAGEEERKLLTAIDSGPNYLSQVVIDWAKKHPSDARVPEALHLSVRASRYGCTDDKTTTLSKAAFEMLHKDYPNSPWTKKTPYYF